MDSEKVIKRDNEYVLHTYARNPIAIEKGHGLYAEGPEGQKYLDFTSGIGVNSLGYCDMTWAEAVSEQAHKLQHTSNLYYTAPCGKLAKKLCKRTGMSCSSATRAQRPMRAPSRPPASTASTNTVLTATMSSRWSTASMAVPLLP